jgi:hypothetical protein
LLAFPECQTGGISVAQITASGYPAAAAGGVWIAFTDGWLTVGLANSSAPFISAQVTMPSGPSLQFGMAAWSSAVTYSDLVVTSIQSGVAWSCEAGYFCASGAFNARGAVDGAGMSTVACPTLL